MLFDISLLSPGIVIIMYLFGELLKHTVCKTDKRKSLIPIVCIIIGAAIGVLLYLFYPDASEATNPVSAGTSGGLSGAAATGCNQLYKQAMKFMNGLDDDEDSDGDAKG